MNSTQKFFNAVANLDSRYMTRRLFLMYNTLDTQRMFIL